MSLRNEHVEQVCDSKKLYDTEWEAERATSLVDFEAKVYKCPGTNHYHIAHNDKSQSMGYGYKMIKCPKCDNLVRRKGASKHITKCKPDKTNEEL